MIKNFYYLKKCRCCGNKELKKIVDLGKQPLANNLKHSKHQKNELYPLEINYCEICHNCQLSICVNPSKLFKNYLYLSSVSKTLKTHFRKATKKYINLFNLNKNSSIIDVGSNDGIGLYPFKTRGFKNLLGIEPASNLSEISNKRGIKTLNFFLENKLLNKINKKADLVLASNVFAHNNNLKGMAKNMLYLLKNSGTLIIEVQHLLKTLQEVTFDNIYHEHYNYWSLISLNYFFKNLGAIIYKAEKIATHGGSIRIYVTKNKKIKIQKNIFKIIDEEKNFGLDKLNSYKLFSKNIKLAKNNVKKNIKKIAKDNGKLIFYGAPAKATTALNFYKISKYVDYIIEDNKLKQGMFIPGINLPIYSKKKLDKKENIIIVLAWNFLNEIKNNNKSIAKKFISIKELEN
tara:strand:+ start:4712 stop:5920 length:1209 start_codon:yes stop_codon:yes gene_type:complete